MDARRSAPCQASAVSSEDGHRHRVHRLDSRCSVAYLSSTSVLDETLAEPMSA